MTGLSSATVSHLHSTPILRSQAPFLGASCRSIPPSRRCCPHWFVTTRNWSTMFAGASATGAVAREVVHDVCVQLLERDEKEDVHTPLALLRKVSHDAAVSRYRSDRRRTAWVEAVAELPEVACMAATPMGRHEAGARVPGTGRRHRHASSSLPGRFVHAQDPRSSPGASRRPPRHLRQDRGKAPAPRTGGLPGTARRGEARP